MVECAAERWVGSCHRELLDHIIGCERTPSETAALALSTLPGNRLERLTANRKGQHGIRVNDQWRVCFERRDGNAHEVEIVYYY